MKTLLSSCVAVLSFTLLAGDSCGFVRMELDACGAVRSLVETATGRELVAAPRPMVTLVLKDGRRIAAGAVRTPEADRFAYSFPGRRDSLVLSVDRFYGGWTFRVESAVFEGVESVEFCRLRPACRAYCGTLVNGLSDADSGVVLRAYDVETDMFASEDELWLGMRGDEDLVGRRFGLSAGPRAEIPQMLRGMTLAAGLPHSGTGGAWSLGAEGNRSSMSRRGSRARRAAASTSTT